MGKVDIHFHRIDRAPEVYRENLLADDGIRLHVYGIVPDEYRESWSQRWRSQGLIPADRTVARVRKWHFYDQWFGIMELADPDGRVLGYYCDTVTPLEKTAEGYRLHDLMLDVWIGADGRVCVLDRDEYEEAAKSGRMPALYQEKALATVEWICQEHEAGRFLNTFARDMPSSMASDPSVE